MWYYVQNNQRHGPIDEEQMKAFLMKRFISLDTLVWTEGMKDWLPAAQTPISHLLPAPAPESIPPVVPAQQPPAQYTAESPQAAAKKLDDQFTWAWVLLIAGTVLSFIFIGIPALIASVVLFYVMLYKFWSVIQDGYARTTPGKAVGFLFIPFFNFYWIFPAYYGLAQDINAYKQRHGISGSKVDESLAMALCILILVDIIPYVNFVSSVASLIIMIILFNGYKNAVKDIILQNQM